MSDAQRLAWIFGVQLVEGDAKKGIKLWRQEKIMEPDGEGGRMAPQQEARPGKKRGTVFLSAQSLTCFWASGRLGLWAWAG